MDDAELLEGAEPVEDGEPAPGMAVELLGEDEVVVLDGVEPAEGDPLELLEEETESPEAASEPEAASATQLHALSPPGGTSELVSEADVDEEAVDEEDEAVEEVEDEVEGDDAGEATAVSADTETVCAIAVGPGE